MKVISRFSAYLFLISTFLVLFSKSERPLDKSGMENNIVILPGKQYYGIKMNIKYNISQSFLDKILDKVLPSSLIFTNSELLNSQKVSSKTNIKAYYGY
ncbi:hypothetical protein CHM_7g135 [Cryptosporidium hominis]